MDCRLDWGCNGSLHVVSHQAERVCLKFTQRRKVTKQGWGKGEKGKRNND